MCWHKPKTEQKIKKTNTKVGRFRSADKLTINPLIEITTTVVSQILTALSNNKDENIDFDWEGEKGIDKFYDDIAKLRVSAGDALSAVSRANGTFDGRRFLIAVQIDILTLDDDNDGKLSEHDET